MAAQWRIRAQGDGISVRLPAWLRELLAQQAEQLATLVGEPEVDSGDPLAYLAAPAEAPDAPTDEVLKRLFPSAYTDAADDEAAGEFRRLTEGDLRTGVRERAATLRRTAAAQQLSAAEAEAWLLAVNDLRLALGARLGLRTDADAERIAAEAPPGSPTAVALEVQSAMGYLQELLVQALEELEAG